jgi:hypothetical protein
MNYFNADFDDLSILVDDDGLIIDTNSPTKQKEIIKPNPRRPILLSEKLPLQHKEWKNIIEVLETKIEGFGFYTELDKLGLGDFSSKINQGQFTLVFLCLRKWDFGAEWFIKLSWLGKKHKPSMKQSIFNQYEPFGKTLAKLLPLTERCHTLSHLLEPGTLRYRTQQETLSAYFMEKKSAEIRRILTRPTYNVQSVRPNTLIGKTKLLKFSKLMLTELKNKRNPYDKDNPHQVNRYCLIDAAIQIIRQGFEVFENDFWKPYIQAEEEWYQYRVKNSQDWWVEADGEKHSLCTRPKGSGKGKLTFPFLSKKQILNNLG